MFNFDDCLLTGVDMVDSQHKAIFEMVNEFYYAVQHGMGYQAARGMLDFLGRYVKDHFADEEKLMIEIEYERMPEHKAEHEGLIAQLAEYMEYDELNEVILTNITNTVVDWLNIHISSEDKDLAGKYVTR